MASRNHKFIESVTGVEHYIMIEYTDETDYNNKVAAIVAQHANIDIDTNEEGREDSPNEEYTPNFDPNKHHPLEDTGEYRQL